MAKAFRCDRCSRYEDDEPVAKVTFSLPTPVAVASGTSARKNIETDLCAQCLASLQEWRDYYTKSEGEG